MVTLARIGCLGACLWVLLAGPTAACGPAAPLSAHEVLEFQMGIIERGLARENLTDAQRAEIATLRAAVVTAQRAERRAEAKAAMQKIVAMFQMKEMFGAVEPIVPGCAPSRANVVTGALADIAVVPNRPGARCGNHYVLTLKQDGGTTVNLHIYDLAKAPYDRLKPMLGKIVEAETLGGSAVTAIRLANPKGQASAALGGLSAIKPC